MTRVPVQATGGLAPNHAGPHRIAPLLAPVEPERCDVCAGAVAAPVSTAERAAMPDLAPWIRVLCRRCRERFGREMRPVGEGAA
jgi:hypothetical protein